MKALLQILVMSVFGAAGVALAVFLALGIVPLPVSPSADYGSLPRAAASVPESSSDQPGPPAASAVAVPSHETKPRESNPVAVGPVGTDPRDSPLPAAAALSAHQAGLPFSPPGRLSCDVGCKSGPTARFPVPAIAPISAASVTAGTPHGNAVFPEPATAATHADHGFTSGGAAPAQWWHTQPTKTTVVPCDAAASSDPPGHGGVKVVSLQEEIPLPPAPILAAPSDPIRAEARQGDQLVMQFRETDLRDALHALARQMNLNVLMSNNVQGTLTASLNGLSPGDAFSAIVAAHGLAMHRQENVVYVGTPADIQSMLQTKDVTATRIYHPNYVAAEEIKALVEPILTPGIGKVTLSTAAEVGIAPDPSKAGGNAYAGVDIVLVRDYETVLREVDRIVKDVDVRPAQVAIEAMIVSVNLDDKDQFGVSFELLRNKGHIRLGWGLPPDDLEKISFDGGLKVAYLDASVSSFITALESIGDTNVIASPRLLVLNKHRAEILIGKELGYISTTITETSASQTVDFLKVGAQLIIRPFISNDGLIRMEVHPELSTGSVEITNNFTVPNKDTTQVTTNIMVPDGVTVIIGGLMREDLQTSSSQLPFLGNLPLVGAAFRHKTETTTKQEIIVLITPHIMGDYQLAAEGKRSALENMNRQQTYAESMSPLGKRSAARHYLQRAREASAAGRPRMALRFARLAVQFDPTNLEAIAVRDSLQGVCPPESAGDDFSLSPAALDGDQLPPEILDALEAMPPTPPLPSPPPPPGGSTGEVQQP
ncbi:MAG: hypothetical protein GYA33_13905 [Thermogutta sp.]|nr:hypothetical protein [Thermogutta sp.]